MADDIPTDSTTDQADEQGRRRGDDEGLKNAMAALLGLRSSGPNGGGGGSSGLTVPPPRRAAPTPAAQAPDPSPPTDASPDDFWSPPDDTASPADRSASEALAPPEAPAPPDDFWALPDETGPAEGFPSPGVLPSPGLSTDDAWRLPVEAEPRPRPAADAPRAVVPEADDDFWSSADEPPQPRERPAREWSPSEWSPESPGDDGPAVPNDAAGPPTGPVQRWSDLTGEREEEPASEPEGSSVTALQDVGMGGPLNTAMGDLRRLYPDSDERVTRDAALAPPVPPAGGFRGGRAVLALSAWWTSRRKELVPGLVVGLVLVLAFAVVLLGRGGDSTNVNTRQPTSVPTLGTSVPGDGGAATAPPLIEEPPPTDPGIDSGEGGPSVSTGEDGPSGQSSVVATTPPRRSGARTTPAPAPAPAPKPQPAAPAPSAPPATPAPTQPPPTSPPPTSPPPDSSGPCDSPLLSAEAQKKCLESLGQGGDD